MVKEGIDGEGTVHLFHPSLVLPLPFLAGQQCYEASKVFSDSYLWFTIQEYYFRNTSPALKTMY